MVDWAKSNAVAAASPTAMAAPEGKKRKRQSHNGMPGQSPNGMPGQSPNGMPGQSPNAIPSHAHKRLLAGETVQLIHLDGDDDAAAHPVLLSAPGVKPPSVTFTAYSRPRSARHARAPVKPSTHDLLLQSSQHPTLLHTAQPTVADHHVKHYVCVYDPAACTLEVAEAHSLTLQTTLRSELSELDQAEQERLSYAQQRAALGSEFGTKKAKKAIAARTENAITAERKGRGHISDVQSAILESVADATAGKASDQDAADALLAAKPIPPPNLAAECAEQVYTFEALVGDAQRYIKVKDWEDKARAGEAVEFTGVQYPATRLRFAADDTRKLKALKYLTLLLEFHNALSTGGRSGKKVPKRELLQKRLPPSRWPEQLVESVRRRFTNHTGQELGKWQMDNLYTHICALALFIDNLEVDIWLLKEDTRLEIGTLGKYFEELGARVGKVTEAERSRRGLTKAQASATRMARLKLPLKFPKARSVRRA